jgi:hypothetical protein
MLSTGFLFGFFDSENGGDVFLRNVGCISPDCRTYYPRRQKLIFEVAVVMSIYAIYAVTNIAGTLSLMYISDSGQAGKRSSH